MPRGRKATWHGAERPMKWKVTGTSHRFATKKDAQTFLNRSPRYSDRRKYRIVKL